MPNRKDAPRTLVKLADRYDPDQFEVGRNRARIRLQGAGPRPFDVVLDGGGRAKLVYANGGHPDAVLEADPDTWDAIASDLRGGMDAYRRGRLKIRRDLHLGVGFLAATAPPGPGGLRIRCIHTARGAVSITEAGEGPPVVMVHGLGATKVSFLPTVAALAPEGFRAIAVDLPGFGDSHKPIAARYDAAFFAQEMIALLDALELERAHVIGNSMGGRVAIEIGLQAPERIARMALLAPSLAWLRHRPWAPYLKVLIPQLGLIQPAPRLIVEQIVRNLIPGSDEEWTSAGIDEFLRSYTTPRGRAAFYAAARNIYLEEPHGKSGFWTRLPDLQTPALFVWGRQDQLVPIGFQRPVRNALPQSKHLELDCGHVPQLERPKEAHVAIQRFLTRGRP